MIKQEEKSFFLDPEEIRNAITEFVISKNPDEPLLPDMEAEVLDRSGVPLTYTEIIFRSYKSEGF